MVTLFIPFLMVNKENLEMEVKLTGLSATTLKEAKKLCAPYKETNAVSIYCFTAGNNATVAASYDPFTNTWTHH